ncbi:hypothetical protein ACFFWE_29745 [Sphaerisporangium melleum]|uniref:hypothetical protein n=1 Tax=Sphaerisporangium melleum TaxID=321316 RepID=UPI0035711980
MYDAAWNLITWNRLWAALFGDPPASGGLGGMRCCDRDGLAADRHRNPVPRPAAARLVLHRDIVPAGGPPGSGRPPDLTSCRFS